MRTVAYIVLFALLSLSTHSSTRDWLPGVEPRIVEARGEAERKAAAALSIKRRLADIDAKIDALFGRQPLGYEELVGELRREHDVLSHRLSIARQDAAWARQRVEWLEHEGEGKVYQAVVEYER